MIQTFNIDLNQSLNEEGIYNICRFPGGVRVREVSWMDNTITVEAVKEVHVKYEDGLAHLYFKESSDAEHETK